MRPCPLNRLSAVTHILPSRIFSFMRMLTPLLVTLLFSLRTESHDVVWWENPEGSPLNTEPLRIDPANDESQDFPLPVPIPPFRTIRVVPEFEFLGPFPVF